MRMTAHIVTHHNGRIWSVHSTPEAAAIERVRAAEITHAIGVEEVEVDGPPPGSEDEAVTV